VVTARLDRGIERREQRRGELAHALGLLPQEQGLMAGFVERAQRQVHGDGLQS
jgi:hypothetical protein